MRKLLSVFTAFAMALTILTGSIALPLVIRPFYRAQIEPLGIPARSGLTAEQIGAAFDDVMDYCLGKRPDFAAGVLSFSPGGAQPLRRCAAAVSAGPSGAGGVHGGAAGAVRSAAEKGPDPVPPGGP